MQISAEDTARICSVSVFPNPTDGHVTVEILGLELEKSAIIVSDISGRNIVHLTEIEEINALDITEQSAGIYFLRVKTGDEEITQFFFIVI